MADIPVESQKEVLRLLLLLETQLTPIIAERATATITVHLGRDKPPVVEVNRKWPLSPAPSEAESGGRKNERDK